MGQGLSNAGNFHSHHNGRGGRRPNSWRYTVQTIPITNRVVTVHNHQYSFNKRLGAGSFGEVYAARRLPDNKHVAIKVISLAARNSETIEALVQSVLTEIEMSKRLTQTSKHIVYMYDFDFDPRNGVAFIVMELGQEDLEKHLATRPALSSAERKAIWRQLVDIAMTLHDRQIVHLDIKPGNLVVFAGNTVKLVDLGIAQKAHRKRIGPNGTVPYSAPEVTTVSMAHITITSRRADVWSFGAVLYRMTYNQPPNFNYTPPCHQPPSGQHSARDPDLVSVLRHTLVTDPRERPETPWLADHPYTKKH